jgi:hypothetical protein
MNANELADSIDKYLDSILEEAIHPIEDVLNEAITMLRQQQIEINSLRNNGYKTHYELLRIEFLNQQAEIEELKALNKSIIDDPLQFMRIKAQEK